MLRRSLWNEVKIPTMVDTGGTEGGGRGRVGYKDRDRGMSNKGSIDRDGHSNGNRYGDGEGEVNRLRDVDRDIRHGDI